MKRSSSQPCGKGGFGITYIAYDWTLKRHMAIKELLPDTIATRIEGSTVVAMGPAHEEGWAWAKERSSDKIFEDFHLTVVRDRAIVHVSVNIDFS